MKNKELLMIEGYDDLAVLRDAAYLEYAKIDVEMAVKLFNTLIDHYIEGLENKRASIKGTTVIVPELSTIHDESAATLLNELRSKVEAHRLLSEPHLGYPKIFRIKEQQ